MSVNPGVYRKIGTSSVHGVGFGAMGISTWYGSVEPDEERLKVLDSAYELGSRHWDTSDIYGDSEELIGKWLKTRGKREEIFLATKFGVTATGLRGDREYVMQAVERSLERLGVETVDLYYIHRIDKKIPIEVTIRALAELVQQGKIKNIGLSECSARTLRRAHAVHPIAAVQMEVSPFALEVFDPQTGLAEAAKELGVTIVAYSPLSRGLLTGRFKSPDDFELNDIRRFFPKFSRENFPKILSLMAKLEEIGTKHNATSGQVTLAWILAKGPNFVVIPGTKKIKYLEENIGAEKVKLAVEEIETIDKLAGAARADLPAERYSAGHMEYTFADTPEEI
ncbi:hypothetical protein AX16_004331 [Volvariella volvacea WC 439]|nr:hypothetical protein AX16_004331 [Volvariella volvacea WC 439]